ncbi:bleomycin resistance protein [Mesorhizobium sp. SARCC-RB16n]|uniref:VOC family protein n=1 Tax=Mesorhizobium sp. SARCC-RB16n TaxID=2116687 RepID=UPI00122EC2F0|nr:bleomycin resistance protein [Mesorhizobium sp. SARCC-RB16n]
MQADFKPVGWPAVVPRLVTSDVQGVVTFLRSTFGAEGDIAPGRPAEMRIFDSIIMVSDGGGIRQSSSAFLHVYVEDTDATYQRAIEAGAREVEPPADMPYGDRRATVQDIWGNTWQVATRRRL